MHLVGLLHSCFCGCLNLKLSLSDTSQRARRLNSHQHVEWQRISGRCVMKTGISRSVSTVSQQDNTNDVQNTQIYTTHQATLRRTKTMFQQPAVWQEQNV